MNSTVRFGVYVGQSCYKCMPDILCSVQEQYKYMPDIHCSAQAQYEYMPDIF